MFLLHPRCQAQQGNSTGCAEEEVVGTQRLTGDNLNCLLVYLIIVLYSSINTSSVVDATKTTNLVHNLYIIIIIYYFIVLNIYLFQFIRFNNNNR